jgi:4'-phosphopantetheinyl transferase
MNPTPLHTAWVQPFDVHVFDLSGPVDAGVLSLLDDTELRRAKQFRFEKDRVRFLVGRGGMRRLLSEQTGIAAADLQFGHGRFGKPMLLDMPDVRFNMSHSGDRAVIAISQVCEVGVDIELVSSRTDVHAVAEAAFCASERIEIISSDAAIQTQRLLVAWTRKEACLKAVGCGLSYPPRLISCGVGPENSVVRVRSVYGSVPVYVQTIRVSLTEIISVAFCQVC